MFYVIFIGRGLYFNEFFDDGCKIYLEIIQKAIYNFKYLWYNIYSYVNNLTLNLNMI